MVLSRHPRTAVWAAAAVLVLGPVAVACSDDYGNGGSSSPYTSTAPATPSEAASGPADPAAAEQQIRAAWGTFFDPAASTDEKVAVLQNGEQLRPVLSAFGDDRDASRVSATVTSVEFTSPTAATVTYDLKVAGRTVLPDAKGSAVDEGGTWKVSVKALCALVELSPNAQSVPGC